MALTIGKGYETGLIPAKTGFFSVLVFPSYIPFSSQLKVYVGFFNLTNKNVTEKITISLSSRFKGKKITYSFKSGPKELSITPLQLKLPANARTPTLNLEYKHSRSPIYWFFYFIIPYSDCFMEGTTQKRVLDLPIKIVDYVKCKTCGEKISLFNFEKGLWTCEKCSKSFPDVEDDFISNHFEKEKQKIIKLMSEIEVNRKSNETSKE